MTTGQHSRARECGEAPWARWVSAALVSAPLALAACQNATSGAPAQAAPLSSPSPSPTPPSVDAATPASAPAPTSAPAAERDDNAAASASAATPDPDEESGSSPRLSTGDGMRKGPMLRMPDFTVSAGLPADVVRRIVRQKIGRFRACYERELTHKPKLEGKFRIDFLITPEGDIASPRISALTLNDASLFTCITNALTTDIVFPQPEAGAPVTVSTVILFAPGG